MSLEEFDTWYREAYEEIEAGIREETRGNLEEARRKYLKGMDLIDLALSVPYEGVDRTGPRWEKLRGNREKIRRTREEVLKRVTDSNKTPLYPKTVSLEKTVIAGVPPASLGPSATPTPVEDSTAEQLLFIPAGVQIFFISPPSNVDTPSEPSSLVIYKMKIGFEERCFVKVGNWVYPLVPGQSPILYSAEGFFVFPDLSAPGSGKSVGVMLSNDTPAEVRDLLRDIFEELSQMKDEGPEKVARKEELPVPIEEEKEPEGAGAKIAHGLIYGAEKVAEGIKWGAGLASTLLDRTGAKLTSASSASAQSSGPVDPRLRSGLRVAKGVSSTAVKVSGTLVSAVGRATMAIGKAAAPHVEKHGSRLLTRVTGKPQVQTVGTVDTVMDVASGAVKGFSTVFMSLEDGAKIVAESARRNTVNVVAHRYGSELGSAADDALITMGYAAMTTYNVSNLGVKGVAKQAAKNTGKVILQGHEERKGRNRGGVGVPGAMSAPLYPELQPMDEYPVIGGGTEIARKQ